MRRFVAASALLHLLGLGLLAVACSGGQVRSQAVAADAVARAWNAVARPPLLAAYEREQVAAIDALCPADAGACERAPLDAAAAAVVARWAPLWQALELAREAHGAWRIALQSCLGVPDSGATARCRVDPLPLAASFAAAAGRARCAAEALGHRELGAIPYPPGGCLPTGDAGR